jgi:hypothetical protein
MKIQPFYLLFLISLFSLQNAAAQYETIDFDYTLGYFNNGQPLPAESYLMFSGAVKPEVDWVEISVFRAIADKNPLAVTTWKRFEDAGKGNFRIPMNYKLRGGSEYSFKFSYFKRVNEEEKAVLISRMSASVESYLQQLLLEKNEKTQLSGSVKKISQNLNTLVVEGLYYYRSQNDQIFPGFSDVMYRALEKLEETNSQGIEASLAIAKSEIEQFLEPEWLVLIDTRKVVDYPTEKMRNSLSINVGYGGVFLNGDLENLSYGTSPYVGLSFPLANRAYASRILSNTSLSLGVFTTNFEDGDENVFSGPIFGRPYYAGLGYSFFRFIRLNAGVTALEVVGSSNVGGGSASLNIGEIKIAPFLGLSAEIDIWAGLKEKQK